MPGKIFFDPVISMPVIIGLAMLLSLLVIAGYMIFARGIGIVRKILLLSVRLFAVYLFAVILMRPMTVQQQEEMLEKPVFAVLADTSKSMNTQDAGGDKSRYEAMKKALVSSRSSLIDDLHEDYDVKLYTFDNEVSRTWPKQLSSSPRAKGESTSIAQSLVKISNADKKKKLRGVLIVSDGRDNSPDSISSITSAARYLRSQQIPVWTAPVGTSLQAKDVYVVARVSSNFIYVDQPANVDVSISGKGYDNWYAKVNLYREDEFITSQQVRLSGGHAMLKFPIREENKGSVRYLVEVEPLAGESDENNNKRAVIAKVIDEQTRVLVIEAKPHWDSKFLLRSLRADTNIEVTSIFHINRRKSFAIVESRDDNSSSSAPGVRMPRTKSELYKYDCIFLGRDIDTVFTSEELGLLKDYLTERGGSVVFFRGKSYSGKCPEIEAIEPVIWGSEQAKDTRFELTASGKNSPIFDYRPHANSTDVIIQQLPSMTSVTQVKNEKSLAVVLAKTGDTFNGEQIATVAYHRYGKGKVMNIGANGLWQWSFLPGELAEFDDIYSRFWGQMVRWLVTGSDFLPGQDISFMVDKNSYAPGEKVNMSIRTKFVDSNIYSPEIELTYPDGKVSKLSPKSDKDNYDLYSTFFIPEIEGEYKAVLNNNIGTPEKEEVRFTVYQDSIETRYVSADREIHDKLSSITGGAVVELNELDDLPEKVQEFEKLSCLKTKPHDVWDRMEVFAILIGALGLEWFIRRASGLV